ncbi:MAG: DeoR/GlpR family DNA-binding transcription regulator [Verrucomicrobiota bacterium]
MLALERHRRLLDLLNTQGGVRTGEVAKTLGVTEETVRRDFEKLEAGGALLRSHGGAVRLEAMRREFPASERAEQNAVGKLRIARAAVTRIRPGQTIFFDASTTALQVAKLLPDQPLTVLTNALQTALALAEKPAIHVVVLGGNLIASSQSCTGCAAEQMLELFRIDAAYISCRGLDAERGPSEATEEQACLKRRVVGCAKEICLLADASKAGLSSSFFFAKNSGLAVWITDRAPAQPFQTAMTSHGTRVEIAPA